MADVVVFDPINLRIVEIDAGGDSELSVLEIYSEWKDWVLADSSRLGYPQAFRAVGGDPISGTQSLGSTFFLMNGWRIRPAESSHKLTLNGNVYTDPAGESVFVPTIGAFNVNTETRVSNLIDATDSDPGAIANAVWGSPSAVLDVPGTAGLTLLEIFRLAGLDPTKPLVVTKAPGTVAYVDAGDIHQNVVETPTETTVTRA